MKSSITLDRPVVYVKNINSINFNYLKNELNITHIVFDKDDTLCLQHVDKLHPSIKESKILEIIEVFGDNSFFCSNDRRNWNFDFEGLSDLVERKKAFRKIETGTLKKPNNYLAVISEISRMSKTKFQPANVCFVGDRVMTDIKLATNLNAFSILVDQFPEANHKWPYLEMIEMENLRVRNHLKPKSTCREMWNEIAIDVEELFTNE